MKKNSKSLLFLILIIVAVIIAVSFLSDIISNEEKLTHGSLDWYFEEDLVKSFTIDGNQVLNIQVYKPIIKDAAASKRDERYELDNKKIAIQKDENDKPIYENYTIELGYSYQIQKLDEKAAEMIKEKVENGGNDEEYRFENYDVEMPAQTPWYQVYLPYIIVGLIFIALWMFLLRQAPGGGKMNSFSKSRAKVNPEDMDPVKFTDVAGADEEKAELEEVVEYLKDPAKFVKLGARIPRGVLLVGPPGTGKTLLAKAVAGEAGVPFFSISGSDFVEMYVGVGASRVRDLFENARKTPASIIFIDEIDAVGRHRGAGLGGGHDEREQTLNQLLVEMDGFGPNSGVIVMAATNRPDILDPALLRPGRFDRRVTVNYPDMNGREAILKVHSRNKPLEDTVDLRKIAQTTVGFTGADLANLMNEAALLAAKQNKALIGMQDIEDSYMKLLLGPQKKSKLRTEADNKLCAYHEAGHAVASYYCKHTDPVKHITIIPAGTAGGVTISVPTEDRMTTSKKQMIDKIILALGGRVAEELVLDDISTGASSDIQHATGIARNMVTRYGMSEKLGTVLYDSEHSEDEVFLGRDFSSGKNYSEKTAADIDDEIRNIISSAYNTCKRYLSDNIGKLHFIAEFLLKNESMDEEQFKAAMECENPTIEEIENIAIEKKKKSEEENKTAHQNNAKAEAEAKARAEAEAEADRIAREAFGGQTGFSSDDFFSRVWQNPVDDENDENDDDSSTTNSSDKEDDEENKESNDSEN